MRRHIASCVAVGLSLQASLAHAQTRDSVLFHRGQWGTEFSIGYGFAAAGILRFSSPTNALLLDVSADYAHDAGSSGGVSSAADNVSIDLRLARRTYRSLEARVYRMVTVGVLARYNWQHYLQGILGPPSEGYVGGIFADIGATWLVTPHLGLGAKFGATLTYGYQHGNGSNSHRLEFSAADATLAGQLYF